jgi:nucleolar protein 53
LWNEDKVEDKDDEMTNSPWINCDTKRHNLRSLRKWKRKLPKDYHEKASDLLSVATPHGGTSYNPSYKEHQELLWKATLTELKKEKAQHKIDYHTTIRYPNAKDAPTEETWTKEMSEGLLDVHHESSESEAESVQSMEKKSNPKLKTRKQRRTLKERKAEEKRRKMKKLETLKHHDVNRVKAINKQLVANEALTRGRIMKRKLLNNQKRSMPSVLGTHKYEEPDFDLKLSDQLTGDLRSLKPEGHLLADRYKSLQKRNVIEVSVKQKRWLKPHKRKFGEKRSYKM